ncbi:uncharacterized protein LOC125779776 [Bactrocera dorsalis]|uniref:Uncharacterized protein LOC125779776 n=1 Tax=Bactrocera dorsalis TaxID=27457 RepID=A0ABM3K6A0_BACDO|nr:uncharacterized protein LOC125779776 [Bactrocera dorsalis]
MCNTTEDTNHILFHSVDDPGSIEDNEAAADVEGRPSTHESGEAEENAEGRPKRARKSLRKEWKREERKRKRNSGDSYVTRKRKPIQEKQFSNLDCKCTKKCFNKITEEQRNKIFEAFWKIGTFSAQNAFIRGLLKPILPVRRRPTTAEKNRTSSNRFSHNVAGETKRVCKRYFLETLKISNGRLTSALEKVKMGYPPGDDKRGKKLPGNKTSDEQMAQVRTHISAFPSYESHYTRKHNPNRKYLAENLNIRLMYNPYKELVESQRLQPVREHIYRRTFNNEFNLQFHAPHKDTCLKCDIFSNKVKYSTDEEEKRKLKQDHELHLRKAE